LCASGSAAEDFRRDSACSLYFYTFNNSGFEHIPDLSTLKAVGDSEKRPVLLTIRGYETLVPSIAVLLGGRFPLKQVIIFIH